ncbi:hypothetical protein FGG79_10360 [Bacillus sp. BHET2]|uniref:helix-hairpin-helix domain-containing protein n=1 Tax=Bacillus sp. BHET2 TaxID=2583818 RepID=UPI00110E9BDA|nr:helix-hairpin-helix domain-containing protein [Bacillus sp. BHET2]TMU85608.1 hypothetical protein FGG79_10360 [Bacillus sp. BHET2]
MQSIIEKYRSVLVIFVICVALLIAFILKNASGSPVEEPSFTAASVEEEVVEPEQVKEPERVYVDVKGEVAKPGLYEVRKGDRLKFVIDRAGGFTEAADEKVMNLAVKVIDEMMIYVPKVGEVETHPELLTPFPTSESNNANSKLNINTATQEEFETLPGIGPAKAATFVQYREENGPFASIEDIQNISGIGEKTFEKLKEHIFVQ